MCFRRWYRRHKCSHSDPTILGEGPDVAILQCLDCGKEWVENK